MRHLGHRWNILLFQASCLLISLSLVFLGEVASMASGVSTAPAAEDRTTSGGTGYPPAAAAFHFSELSELVPGLKPSNPAKEVFRVPVLMYHSISADPNPLCVSPDRFTEQLDWLQREGYTTITMETLLNHLYRGEELPPRPVVITLDDGYLDNYDYAFPLLRERKMVATIFLISSTFSWEYRLGPAQIKEMSGYGIEFGSHTVNHINLSMAGTPRLAEELEDSRRSIEAATNREVVSFCYPFGKYSQKVIDAVREAGYYGAVTTEPGMVTEKSGLYRFPRVRVNGSDRLEDFKAKLGSPSR